MTFSSLNTHHPDDTHIGSSLGGALICQIVRVNILAIALISMLISIYFIAILLYIAVIHIYLHAAYTRFPTRGYSNIAFYVEAYKKVYFSSQAILS